MVHTSWQRVGSARVRGESDGCTTPLQFVTLFVLLSLCKRYELVEMKLPSCPTPPTFNTNQGPIARLRPAVVGRAQAASRRRNKSLSWPHHTSPSHLQSTHRHTSPTSTFTDLQKMNRVEIDLSPLTDRSCGNGERGATMQKKQLEATSIVRVCANATRGYPTRP